MDIINDEYNPTFSFMTYDHDGKVRMVVLLNMRWRM